MSDSTPLDPYAIPPAEHPGIQLRETLEARELTAYRLYVLSGVSQSVIGQIIKGKRGITAETSIRFGKALGTTPGFWLGLQCAHDLHLAAGRVAGGAAAVAGG